MYPNSSASMKVSHSVDLTSTKLQKLVKEINDPSNMLPTGTELGVILLANGLILRDLVLRNCVAVTGSIDVKVFGTIGNTGTNVAGETPDEVTDEAANGGYQGGVAQIGATVTIQLADVGYTRIPMGNVFLQDEGYVSVTFKQNTGAACFNVAMLADDMQLECTCGCPVIPCNTEYPDPECCV